MCIIAVMILSAVLTLGALIFKYSNIWLAAFILMLIVYTCFAVLLIVFIVPVITAVDVSKEESGYDEKRVDHIIIRFIEQLIEKRQREFAHDQTKELVQKQVEFNELQNQINPHFLYNTLESIRAEALSENAVLVANMVRSLSSFYRYSIGRYHTLVTFREELENIDNYFAIQRYRFGERFSLEISIMPEDERCLELYIIKLSIQPIIENAIFHGIETKPEDGHVRISVDLTPSRFIIIVSDNGIGVPPERLMKINQLLHDPPDDLSSSSLETAQGTGMGLLNINKRIRMYFGNEYGLLVRSVVNVGTDIEIVLPVVTDIGR